MRRTNVPALVETEAEAPDQPQAIAGPAVLSGRINPVGDVDVFGITLKKGETRRVRVESRSLGQPLDPVLSVTDAGGKSLAEVDDADGGRDAELRFTAPADGEFRVRVRDLNGRGGVRFVYLLRVEVPEPDYRLSVKADGFTLTPGKPLEIPVGVERQDGFAGAIAIQADGLPEGLTVTPGTSEPKGKSAKSATLRLEAGPDLAPWSGPFRIVGRADGPPEREHAARAALGGSGASTEAVWLTILPAKSDEDTSKEPKP